MKYLLIILLLCCAACINHTQNQPVKPLVDTTVFMVTNVAPTESVLGAGEEASVDDPVQLEKGEVAIGSDQLADYLKNTFHYDSTFGRLIHATLSTHNTNQNERKLTVTTFEIPGHQFRLESTFNKKSSSEQTAFYHNGNLMPSKGIDGKPVEHAGFDFKDAPYVKLYKVDGKDFYYVEGSASDAVIPAFRNIVYAFIFDISANTVYNISVLNQDLTCYMKAENGHLVVLNTLPLNGLDDVDSLRVKERIVNY